MSNLKGRQARMAAPVNSNERLLDPKNPIVTKTDSKGKIVFANPAFVEISGFTHDELIGQPHNVVRHPDMPREAFDDLWHTIQNDQPWRGLVKNRCKDGEYYWVDAYVTPLTENGQKVGYMSVRSKPTEQQKTDAQNLYDKIRNGQATFPKTPIRTGRPFAVDLATVCLLPGIVALGSLIDEQWAIFLFPILGMLMSFAGLYWVQTKVKHMNKHMLDAISALAEGNFKYETPHSSIREFNSIFTGLRSMQVNLRAIVADVVSGSTRVKNDASDLTELAKNLMERSKQQSDGINSVAAALEELSVSVSEISEATNKSSDHANNAMVVVGEGSSSMQRSTEATQQVSKVVLAARTNIEELNLAVEKISNVTLTIKQIAEKTNLLALNAAIEAARAGEFGRGFAVVADEVRKLAEMTRHSTTEISVTVQDVQNGTSRALETMEVAVKEVNSSTHLIQQANDSLQAIKQASHGVAQSAQDISSMLEQQTQASVEVANSMEKMSTLTESNVAAIQALDSSAQTLSNTSNELRVLVKHFESSL